MLRPLLLTLAFVFTYPGQAAVLTGTASGANGALIEIFLKESNGVPQIIDLTYSPTTQKGPLGDFFASPMTRNGVDGQVIYDFPIDFVVRLETRLRFSTFRNSDNRLTGRTQHFEHAVFSDSGTQTLFYPDGVAEPEVIDTDPTAVTTSTVQELGISTATGLLRSREERKLHVILSPGTTGSGGAFYNSLIRNIDLLLRKVGRKRWTVSVRTRRDGPSPQLATGYLRVR